MGHERIDLVWQTGVVRERRWRCGRVNGHDERFLTAGRLADGRRFVHHTGRGNAVAFDDEAEAEALLERWLATEVWRPTPACFGPDQQPSDGGSWVLRGQEWMPA